MGKFFALLFFGLLALWFVRPSETKAPEPKLSPEEQAKKDAANKRWVTQVVLVRALRKSMKNPDSFKIEEAIELDDGTICMTYRATNSFNAIVPGQAVLPLTGAVATSDDKIGFIKRWSATCAKKSGRDIRHIRMAL